MQPQPYQNKDMTLLDLLDGIIDKGAVVSGELIISMAGIDLIMIDLKLLIATIDHAFHNQIIGYSGGERIPDGTDSTGAKQCRAGIS